MAAAIYLQTESGDDYVFAFDGEPTKEQIISELKDKMIDKYEYLHKLLSKYNLKLTEKSNNRKLKIKETINE